MLVAKLPNSPTVVRLQESGKVFSETGCTMWKTKLIVQKIFQGKRSLEELIVLLNQPNDLGIHFVPGKEQMMEQVMNESNIYRAVI